MKITKRLWILFLAAGLMLSSVSCVKEESPPSAGGVAQNDSIVTETNETTIIETGPFATETEAEFLAFQERLFERYLELNQPKKEEIVVQFQELLSFSYRNLSELKLYYNKYLGHYDRESVIENLTTRVYYRPLLLNYLCYGDGYAVRGRELCAVRGNYDFAVDGRADVSRRIFPKGFCWKHRRSFYFTV
ncbi:MAG: hypothetical protein IKD18_02775 [Clostridia bacterium]|nr:hypothetical protein [Clostridia bacterium]